MFVCVIKKQHKSALRTNKEEKCNKSSDCRRENKITDLQEKLIFQTSHFCRSVETKNRHTSTHHILMLYLFLYSLSHLFDKPQQVLLAAAFCCLLVWSQSAEVSTALRLQVSAAVQTTFNAVKDDRQRPGQQTGVMIRT